ncbi:MAG TPA: alpha/beta fold hydrolase [Dehalococcoidia bacterium]|nr:alpha/beta fold hydrolase [Dehalococcoidia bacterium]
MAVEVTSESRSCGGCGQSLQSRRCGTCDAKPPSLFNEWQYALELSQLYWDPVYYGWGVPRGDGAPILLIPGFLAGDLSMAVLGEWLRRTGYAVYYPGIWTNTDCPDRMVLQIRDLIARITEQHGRRIIVVGHSKGGYLGRVLGQQFPDLIRHVIALGSPFNDPLDIHPFTLLLVDLVKLLYRQRGARSSVPHHYGPLCYSTACQCDFALGLRGGLPTRVRYTAVYSRNDGVVRWRHCLDEVPENNFEVTGTHLGLIFNSQVFRYLGQLLAQSTREEREEAVGSRSSR